MRKPTISVLLPTGTDSHMSDSVKLALFQTKLAEQFTLHVSPLRLDETALGIDPWNEIDCPVCNQRKFVTVDHAQVYCENCLSEFRIRPTAGDPGYCVDAITDNAIVSEAVNPAIIGMELFMVAKNGDDYREWLVKEKQGSVVSLDLFLTAPSFSMLSSCKK